MIWKLSKSQDADPLVNIVQWRKTPQDSFDFHLKPVSVYYNDLICLLFIILSISDHEIHQMTTVVQAFVGGKLFPIRLSNTNACRDSGLVCPMEKNSKQTFLSKFYLDNPPSVSILNSKF